MNKERRKTLGTISDRIEALKGKYAALTETAAEIKQAIEQAKEDLESVRNEEQDAFDNMPESLQDGERGQAMSAAIDALDSADSELDSMAEALEAFDAAEDEIDAIVSYIDDARGHA